MTLPKLTSTQIIAIIAIALLAYAWWSDRRGGRGDGDYSAVEAASHDAIVRFGKENAAMCNAIVKGIRSGKLKTDYDITTWVEENREEARLRAFKEVNSVVQRDMPRDEHGHIDADEAESFFKAQAAGFGGVK